MGTTDEVKTSAFERLAAVNVGAKVEKKNGFSYLSWAWAWDQLLRIDPEASFEYPDPKTFGDTMMVFCTVTAFCKSRTAHLPVMDYKNRPIPSPDAFQVNTAMQRCFVKAIALHGLGLYLYAGEDLPEGEDKAVEKSVEKKGKTNPAKNVLGKKPYYYKDGITVSGDREEELEGIISRTLKWCSESRWADALLEMDNNAQDNEEKIFMWDFLDSAQRSAITKEVAAQKVKYMNEKQGEQA
jgi:hypothetical protein